MNPNRKKFSSGAALGLLLLGTIADGAKITQPKQTYKFKTELPIKLMGFIPTDHVDDPTPFSNLTFAGDARSFNADAPTSNYRVRQRVTLIPVQSLSATGLKDGTNLNDTGITVKYDKPSSIDPTLADSVDPDGKLTAAAKADEILNDTTLKLAVAQANTNGMNMAVFRAASRKVRVAFNGDVADPLSEAAGLFGCTAAWELVVEVNATDVNNPQYSISGTIRAYPSYEVYIDQQRVLAFDSLHRTGPASLCLPQIPITSVTGPIQP